ncbi:MAG: hypothetical protein ACK5NY_11175 [Burkholderiaceae bacterium]
MILIILVFEFALAVGARLNGMRGHQHDSAAELMGTYVAPTLAGAPTPRGCDDQRCKTLDALEAKGYELARQRKITWVKLVDAFYSKRAELYPNSQDGYGVNELRTYQRALAEQMDIGKLTESQWAYLIEKKNGEINARNQAISNTAPRQTNCTTTNVGTSAFPQYNTTCN